LGPRAIFKLGHGYDFLFVSAYNLWDPRAAEVKTGLHFFVCKRLQFARTTS